MADDIETRIRKSYEDTDLETRALKLGLEKARDHYFETWDALTNRRIDALLEPEGIGDMLVQLAVAGVGGLAVEMAMGRFLSKIMSSRVGYVDVQIKAKIPKENRDQVRQRLKLHGYKVSKKKVKFNHRLILNEGTSESLIYNVVPNFMGSRVDTLLQTKRPKENLWPDPGSVADYLHQTRAWIEAQDVCNQRIRDEFLSLASGGRSQEVGEALDFQDAVVGPDAAIAKVYEHLVRVGSIHGSFFLASLIVRRFGDPYSYGKPIMGQGSPLPDGRIPMILSVKINKGTMMSNLLEALEDRLIDPDTDPPKTFLATGLARVTRDRLPRIVDEHLLTEKEQKKVREERKAYAQWNAHHRIMVYLKEVYRGFVAGPIPADHLRLGSEAGSLKE